MTNNKLIKFFIFWMTWCLVLGVSGSAVLAQSPTPAPEESVAPEIKDTIKERLEKTIGDNVDKIQGLITEEQNSLKKRAFFGEVESITKDTLTINTDEDVKQASFNDDTTLVKLPGRTDIEIEDLAVGDFIIAMGFLNENGVLETRRIVVSPQPKPAPVRKLFWGEIEEIDNETIAFDGQEIEISEKMLQIKGVEDPSLEDISLGDKLFVLATVDDEGEIDEVKNVLVVPVKNALEIQTTPIETEEETDEAEADLETAEDEASQTPSPTPEEEPAE